MRSVSLASPSRSLVCRGYASRPGVSPSEARGTAPAVQPCSVAPGSPGESIPRGPRVLPRGPRGRHARVVACAAPYRQGTACGACSQSTPGAGCPRGGHTSPRPMAVRKQPIAHARMVYRGCKRAGVCKSVAESEAMAMGLCRERALLLGVGSGTIAPGQLLRALQVREVVRECARWLRTWRLSSRGGR